MCFLLQNHALENAKEDPSLFFRDGRRRIDMVLAYEEDDSSEFKDRRSKARVTFEENLKAAGLELEHEDKEVRVAAALIDFDFRRRWRCVSKLLGQG